MYFVLLVTGHWSLVTFNWSLVTGHWSLSLVTVTRHAFRVTIFFRKLAFE